ncbi:hypothetical protein OROMI_012258 [Orobanche minor]
MLTSTLLSVGIPLFANLNSSIFGFFPKKAASLAREVVNEPIQELKIRPCPIIHASFSGGPKACMYKVIQIIEGKCEEQINLDECRLVRDSVSGYIFDSCPVDFVSDMRNRFFLHQTGLKISSPPLVASWILMAYPPPWMHYFLADSNLNVLNIGRLYTPQLEGEKIGMEGGHDEIFNPFNNPRKAAAMSRDSLHRANLDLNDYFHVPSSVEYHEDRDVGSVPDQSKGRYIPQSSPPKINARGILGPFLFDVCVPKNVED